uniref:CCR4 Not complex component Not1 n=1 Tax=Echinococcus granulosus TaxID=6210 RepID=A0A068WT85_ECHGR|nr:CCR4 Not complex component Not1 [Echinococcus granulosus]
MLGAECLSLTISQIDYLVSVLNKKNDKAAFSEILELCAQNPGSVERNFFRCLFSHIDLSQCDTKMSSKDSLQVCFLLVIYNYFVQLSYLIQGLRKSQSKSNFTSLICFAVQSLINTPKDSSQLNNGLSSVSTQHDRHPIFAFVLKLLDSLPLSTGLPLGLSLTHATNADVKQCFSSWLHSRFTALIDREGSSLEKEDKLVKLGTSLIGEIGVERVNFLLAHLLLPSSFRHLSPKVTLALRRGIQRASALPISLDCYLSTPNGAIADAMADDVDKGEEDLTLSPSSSIETFFLTPSNQLKALTGSPSKKVEDETQSSADFLLADAFEDLGFMALSTCQATECLLSQFSSIDVTTTFVARSMCVMIRTAGQRSFLPSEQFVEFLRSTNPVFPENFSVNPAVDEWPVENFLSWVHCMNSDLSVSQVISELDCPYFHVPNQAGLAVLKHFLVYEVDRQQNVSLGLFYRPWKNASGQLSLLQQCSLHPETNILIHTSTAHLSGLRLGTEDKAPLLQIWKNSDFVTALLHISTVGFFNEARSILDQGFNHSPDIFTATLLATSEMVPLKCKMLSLAFTHFLLPHTNSQSILQTVWTGPFPKLTDTQRCFQRSLFLTTCLKLVESWGVTALSNGTETLSSVSVSSSVQATFFNLIDILLRIRGDSVMPLAMMLGSRAAPVSLAVSQLWPGRSVAEEVPDANAFAEISEPPSVAALLDLAFSLVVYMVDAVKAFMGTGDCSSEGSLQHLLSTPIPAIQTTLDSFLTNWFTEQMTGEKEDADAFCVELLRYLCRRYPSLVDTSGAPLLPQAPVASMPLPSALLETNRHLPVHLRRPPAFIIRHIINSARKALRWDCVLISFVLRLREKHIVGIFDVETISSGRLCVFGDVRQHVERVLLCLTISVSPKVASETNQTLAFYLQNLNRIYSLSGASSFGSCVVGDQTASTIPASTASVWASSRDADPARVALAANLHKLIQRGPSAAGSGPSMAGTVPPPVGGASGSAPPPPSIYLNFNIEPPELNLSSELDVQVNAFFHKLLQGACSVEDMVKCLYEYAASDSPGQKKLLDGILRVLTYEVTSHLHDYPEHALHSITELYGGILAGLVTQLSVSALSMLWKAFLNRVFLFTNEIHTETPAFRAVVNILNKTKPTFIRYVNLTNYLVNCFAFKHFPSELRDAIASADAFCKSFQCQQSNSHPHLTGSQSLKDLQIAGQTATALHTQQILLQQQQQQHQAPPMPESAPPESPDESVRDRIFFVFNNVSPLNAKEKAEELCGILQESTLPWFAHYLVNKRVTVENSFLEVFDDVVDEVQKRFPTARQLVLSELFRAIKGILRNLRSDVDDPHARGCLKSLGRFLGLLTLARNKPILHDDLSLKELILEAEEKGSVALNFVIPFISNVLRGAVDSVFAPPSPYTMAILKVLRELYDVCDMKVQLKFEIELTCKMLGYELRDLTPAEYLRNRNNLANLEKRYIFYVNPSAGTASSTGQQPQPQPQQQQQPPPPSQLTNQARALQAQATLQAQQAIPYDTPAMECNPRSLAALAHQQHQRLAAAQQQQPQHQQMYAAASSTAGGRSNVFTALLEGAQSNPAAAAAAAVMAGNVHRGDSIYSYGGAAAADDSFRRKWDPALVAMQQNAVVGQQPQQQQPSLAQPQQQQQPGRQQQPQLYPQVAAAVVATQQISAASTSTYNPAAAAAGLPHVVSAPQLVSSTQQARELSHSGTAGSAGSSLPQYDDLDLSTVRSSVNMEEIIQQLYAISQSSVQNLNSNAALKAFNMIRMEAVRAVILPAIEKCIKETLGPLAERSISLALSTTETLIRKDFAFHSKPMPMLCAAKQMVRHLAAASSLTSGREAFHVSLCNNLISSIWNIVKFSNQHDKEAVELIAMVVAARVAQVSVSYMQKTIAERAVWEVEKKLEADVKLRQELGPRRFEEQISHSHQNLPECVRVNTHLLNNMRLEVYQEFGRSIPGFAPPVGPMSPESSHFPLPTSTGAAVAAAQAQQMFQRTAGPMVPQPTVSSSSTSGTPQQIAVAAKLLFQQHQQQQYLQQQQQQPHTSAVTSQQPPQQQQQQTHPQQQPPQSTSSMNLFDSIVMYIRRHLANITKLLAPVTPSQEPAMVRSLHNLVEIVQLAKATAVSGVSSGGGGAASGGENVCVRIIAFLIQSLLTHYRPSQWTEQPGGLQVMEHLKEAHMITLRHLLSCEQNSWVTKQVTNAWIQLPDGDAEPSNIQRPVLSASTNASKVEQLSTLATLAVAKSGTRVSTGGDSNNSIGLNVSSSKWNWEAFAELLKVHVLYLTQIDAYLAGKIASGHMMATTFVLNLLDHFVLPIFMGSPSVSIPVDSANAAITSQLASNSTRTIASSLGNVYAVTSKREFTVLNEYDLWLTIRALQAQQRATLVAPGDFNLRLRLSCARVRALMDWGLFDTEPLSLFYGNDSVECAALFVGCSRAREFDDTQQMKAKTENYFRWWVEFYRNPQEQAEAGSPAEQAINNLIGMGFLSSDESLTRFFRLATIYVVERTLNNLKQAEQASTNLVNNTRNNNVYIELDAYARLISYVVNWPESPVENGTERNNPKIALLSRVLGIIGGTLMQSHEVRPELFHPMPFERILVMLFMDLCNNAPTPPRPANSTTATSTGETGETQSKSLTLHEYIPIAFGKLFHMLRPTRVAKFTLAFLEVIGHRYFVSHTLGASVSPQLRAAYRAVYAQLLADMLTYLAFYLQNAIALKHVTSLFIATFRLCLVLFHDFPDFISDYCLFFCNIISSSAIQLRNLILSSEPRRGVSPTDPLNAPPVNQLSQLEDPIGYTMEAGNRLPPVLRSEIDSYLSSRVPTKLLSELSLMLQRVDSVAALLISPSHLLTSALNVEHSEGGDACSQEVAPPPPPPQGKKAKKAAAAKAAAAAAQQHAVLVGAAQQANMAAFWAALGSQMLSTYGVANNMHYSAELMTDLVLYLCITAVRSLRDSGTPLNVNSVANTPQMEILQALIVNLDDEGCYLLLNCMANQLRYLNSHTYYFSYSLLYLFAELPMQKVKEQISRVLMERLIVNRPHPWGLLMTSAELLRNPIYHYWDHEFARCHKDMEDIVTVVARSCISNFTPPQSSISGGGNSSNSNNSSSAVTAGGGSQPSNQMPSASSMTQAQGGAATSAAPTPSPQPVAETKTVAPAAATLS